MTGHGQKPDLGRPLGLVIHSLWNRWQGKYSSVKLPPLTSVEEVLDLCFEQGFGGLQTTVAGWTKETARAIRNHGEAHAFYIEGSIELPNDRGEVALFERQVRLAKEAGATVLRCYMGGRRYEDLQEVGAFKRYAELVLGRVGLAEPVLRRHGVRLGVENHKDFRAAELAELLNKVSSENVGWCFDFGNNLALLEDADRLLQHVGPFLVTTHVKDMALMADEVGFQMAEVPLGQGVLDLPHLLQRCVEANPKVTFNLEMITRDPLRIPCLEKGYWKSMSEVSGAELADLLRFVRDNGQKDLLRIGERSSETISIWEEQQNLASLAHAQQVLGLVKVD